MESVVQCDWENGYVECSAMFNTNVTTVFKELLNQARSGLLPLPTFPLPDRSQGLLMIPGHCGNGNNSLNLRRRQSLPVVPVFNKGDMSGSKRREGRRGSVAVTNLALAKPRLSTNSAKHSCKIS